MKKILEILAIIILLPLAIIKSIIDIVAYPLLKMSGIKNDIKIDIDGKTIIVDINGERKIISI